MIFNFKELNEKDYSKIKKRIFNSLRKFGKTELTEDYTHDWIVRISSGLGGKQTFDQFVIDNQRRERGREGLRSSSQRFNFENAHSIEQAEFIDPSLFGVRTSLDDRIDFGRMFSGQFKTRKIDTEIAKKFYIEGLSEVEIANIYQVSESRISQRIKRFSECLRSGIKHATSRQGRENRIMETILHIKRSCLEFPENQKMALEKPFEMEINFRPIFEKWLT